MTESDRAIRAMIEHALSAPEDSLQRAILTLEVLDNAWLAYGKEYSERLRELTPEAVLLRVRKTPNIQQDAEIRKLIRQVMDDPGDPKDKLDLIKEILDKAFAAYGKDYIDRIQILIAQLLGLKEAERFCGKRIHFADEGAPP